MQNIWLLSDTALVISAVSAFATLAAWRAAVASKTATQDMSKPIILGKYDNKRDGIFLSNHGQGPAFNVKLEPNTLHYADINTQYEFALTDGRILNLLADSTKKLPIDLKKLGKQSSRDFDSAFAAFQYYFVLGRNRYIGIIFEDVHGRKFIERLKSIEEDDSYNLELVSLKKYKLYRQLYDWLIVRMYRAAALKRIREKKWQADKHSLPKNK